MGGEVLLVPIHDEELAELHVLVPLQGQAVAGPTQPLQVDAETLRELESQEGEREMGLLVAGRGIPMCNVAETKSPKFLPNGNPRLALRTSLGPRRTSVEFLSGLRSQPAILVHPLQATKENKRELGKLASQGQVIASSSQRT